MKQQILSILTALSVATALTPQKPAEANPGFLLVGLGGRMAVISGTVLGVVRGCSELQMRSNISCGQIAITVYNGVRQYYAPVYPRGDFQRPTNGRWM